MENEIRAELTEFIVTNYLFGDVKRTPRDDDALVAEGIIDSTGKAVAERRVTFLGPFTP